MCLESKKAFNIISLGFSAHKMEKNETDNSKIVWISDYLAGHIQDAWNDKLTDSFWILLWFSHTGFFADF